MIFPCDWCGWMPRNCTCRGHRPPPAPKRKPVARLVRVAKPKAVQHRDLARSRR